MKVAETNWKTPTPDGHTIYGLKNTCKGNTKAIFLVHGLTGHMYEYAFKRAADYFPEHGYDVFRFNLYDGQENARNLTDCTLLTHAADLNTVLAAHAKKYQKIFVSGHSYGGPTVMLANPSGITAASLWDPSFDLPAVQRDFASGYGKLGAYVTLNWGITSLMSKKMFDHAATLDKKACLALSKAFKAPIQVIFAGNGYYVKKKTNYHSAGHPKNRADTVPGTTHCFYEGQSAEELLRLMHQWLNSW